MRDKSKRYCVSLRCSLLTVKRQEITYNFPDIRFLLNGVYCWFINKRFTKFVKYICEVPFTAKKVVNT